MKEKFAQALKQLKQDAEKREFVQGVDLIVNLVDVDLRKTPLNIFFSMPNPLKVSKVCGFFEKKSPSVDRSVTKAEMQSMDKDQIRDISRDFDSFISAGPLMSQVAITFGKILGPLGKMPNPKTGGVVLVEDENVIHAAVKKIRSSTNIKAKEASIKTSVGKQSFDDDKLAENCEAVYNAVLTSLPNRKENIRSVMVKFTMSKPIKIAL